MPIVVSTVPRVVKPVGSEDMEELVQDTLATAAQMVDQVEASGQSPIARSIAYYAIQRTKAGRRSTYAGRMDLLSSAARMDREGALLSLEDAVAGDDGEEAPLGDLLADSRQDDPAIAATRKVDCEEFLAGRSPRERAVVNQIATGRKLQALANRYRISPARISQIQRELGQAVRTRLGENILAEAAAEPAWRVRNVRAVEERRACRWARARAAA